MKEIPGTRELKIDLKGNIKVVSKDHSYFRIEGKKVIFDYYSKRITVDKDWLGLIAFYEVVLPEPFRDEIMRIKFLPIAKYPTRSRTGKIMVIRPALEIVPGYRLVPNFTNYAISEYGEVYVIKEKRFLNKPVGTKSYLSNRIYNPEYRDIKDTYVHRLVALAWIMNDDFVERSTVNHKDGNRANPHKDNLEWASYKENIDHAFETGLRIDKTSCKIRDTVTGEVMEFHSINRMREVIGVAQTLSGLSLTYVRPTKLYLDRYEVRLEGDDRPWMYDKGNIPYQGRYTFYVDIPGREQLVYHDVRTPIKDLKIPFPMYMSKSAVNLAERIPMFYPGAKVKYEDHYAKPPVQALCIKTGKVIEDSTYTMLGRKLGIVKTRIKVALSKGPEWVSAGYRFRYKSDDPWPTEVEVSQYVNQGVVVLCSKTNKKIVFPSLRAASRHFKIDRKNIHVRIRNGTDHEGWLFSRINEDIGHPTQE